MHDVAPSKENIPALHAIQLDPDRKVPAVHTKPVVVHAVAPATDVVSDTHAVHDVEPIFATNCPAAQRLHADDELAPVVAKYVPVGQAVHATAPMLPE